MEELGALCDQPELREAKSGFCHTAKNIRLKSLSPGTRQTNPSFCVRWGQIKNESDLNRSRNNPHTSVLFRDEVAYLKKTLNKTHLNRS